MTLPLIQVNCDTAPWVREKKPVFCEKRTEIVDGVYVTTRGCSIDYRSSHANISFKFICVWRSVLRIRITLMQIRIRLFILMRIRIRLYTLMQIRIRIFTLMQIRFRLFTFMRTVKLLCGSGYEFSLWCGSEKKIRPSSKLCKFAITGLQTLHGSIVTRELPRLYCEPHPPHFLFPTEINNSIRAETHSINWLGTNFAPTVPWIFEFSFEGQNRGLENSFLQLCVFFTLNALQPVTKLCNLKDKKLHHKTKLPFPRNDSSYGTSPECCTCFFSLSPRNG